MLIPYFSMPLFEKVVYIIAIIYDNLILNEYGIMREILRD